MRKLLLLPEHMGELQTRALAIIAIQDDLFALKGTCDQYTGMYKWLQEALNDAKELYSPSEEECSERLKAIRDILSEEVSLKGRVKILEKRLEFLQEGVTFFLQRHYGLEPRTEQWHVDMTSGELQCQSSKTEGERNE